MDMLFASTVTLFLFVTLVVTSDMVYFSFSADGTRAELQDAALSAADALVSTPGTPSNWSESQSIDGTAAAMLGLASSRGVLDADKVAKFFVSLNTTTLNSNYTNARTLLGLGRPGYNFSLSVYNSSNDRILNTNASIFPAGANSTASVQRYAVYNGSVVRVNLRVWKDENV